MFSSRVAVALLTLALTACSGGPPPAARSRHAAAGLRAGDVVEPAARCAVPAAVRATQVLLVHASGTDARVTACARTPRGTYRRVLGPYAGHVGRSGVAAAGKKREGDGATPGGILPLRGAFGTARNPGTRLHWMPVGGRDVWVDDPRSARYNTHQVLPVRGRWRSAERLRIRAYEYAQVIGWNEAREPGLGSAIFLHLDSGRPTAGCVSLPREPLLRVLRWQNPGAVIVIR